MLIVPVDTKDLYHSMSSQRNATDKSVRADVASIRCYYETEVDISGWIPGSANPGDTETKLNSSLVDLLAPTLAAGKMQVNFDKIATASRHHKLG